MLNVKLVTTGNDPVPIQFNPGVVFARDDMTITDEKAETLFIRQVAGEVNILVVADEGP